MGDQSQTSRANPKIETKKKSEFEFCKVCNLNHDQGLRHKYFPNHQKRLSTFLSRFQKKISDIRFLLKSPTTLMPEHASRNRFWCVFCDTDIDEIGSSFACANAINHLASVNHLKNLKQFLWKSGGDKHKLDAFRILDTDIAKWEKKCTALTDDAVSLSEGCHGAVFGPSSDIHNQVNYGNIDSFENVYSHSVKSYPSNGVLPLQYYTNEYQVSYSGLSGGANADMLSHSDASSLPSATCSDASPYVLKDFAVSSMGIHCGPVDGRSNSFPCNGRQWSSDGYSSNKGVYEDGRVESGGSSYQGLQVLTQISSAPTENSGGNVHSGAPPPWLEATEGTRIHTKPVLGDLSSSNKYKKLNPKRVGAAWAEKRKIELEMEKQGEAVRNECDANWLPNFGRVWQSGSRKESRKEFEREKQKLFKVESQSEMSIKIQPYVSKRMRMDSDSGHASG